MQNIVENTCGNEPTTLKSSLKKIHCEIFLPLLSTFHRSNGVAYVAHLHHVDCCRNVSHRGGCWRYAKQSQPAWVKIDTLGNDLISIAPRFAHKGDLKAPIHATCFRVVANPTPERHQNCQLLVHHVFETSGTTITAEEAHMLAGLVPVKRFWYAFQDGTDMDPAMLMCSACQKPLRWAGAQRCRTRGLGMACLFQLISPKLRCTACSKTYVAWSPAVRAQIPQNVAPTERLDCVGYRFLEPAVTDFLCATLRDTFHRGALKTKYLAQLKVCVKRALPTGWGGASALARSIAEAMLTQFLPSQHILAGIVLRVFQATELPRVPAEIRAISAVFGAVVNIDGSSAPLHEMRPLPTTWIKGGATCWMCHVRHGTL